MKAENNSLELFRSFAKAEKATVSGRDSKLAILYTRVSSKKQMEGVSLEVQNKMALDYARSKGYQILETFGGTHESAKVDDRKEFNRMMKFLGQNRRVSTVLVFSFDRFSRSENAFNIDMELKRRGVNVVSITQPVDLESAVGDVQKGIMYLFGYYENQERKKRCVSGTKERLRQGHWPHLPPLGYTNLNPRETCDKHKLVVNKEGRLLEKAFAMKGSGRYRDIEILEWLHKRGLKMTDKKLSWVFRNPFYCGVIVSKILPGEIIQGRHPAIVSQQDFLKINGLLKQKGESGTYHKEEEMLPLKIFTVCDITGAPYTGYICRKKQLYYYKTRGKGTRKNRSAKALNALFADFLTNFQLRTELQPLFEKTVRYMYAEMTKESRKQEDEIRQRLEETKRKLDKLEYRYVMEEAISREQYEKFAPELRGEIAMLDNEYLRIQQANSSNLDAVIEKAMKISENLREMWVSSDFRGKVKLQSLVFPEGIRYNRENDVVRTTRVNSLFLLIQQLTRLSEGQKKGGNSQLDDFPHQVELVGVEPTSKHGINKLSTCLVLP